MINLETATAEELLALAEAGTTGFEPQATTADPRGLPQANQRVAKGRPKFTDPTDPCQIWAICNRKGVVSYIWCATLDSWVEVPKSKLKGILQNLPDGTVRAKLVDDGPRGHMLLIG